MESEALAKTLEVLEAISGLELGIAEFYLFCSGVREREKDFWLTLEQDEQKHARKVREMAQMLGDRQSLLVPNTSFNVSQVYSLKNFIAKSLKRLQKNQIPTDYKTLLSIAWNIEYSVTEINYNALFSIAQQEYEDLMQTITSETAAHRGILGSKITAMRNSPARAHHRPVPKGPNEAPKRSKPRGYASKLH